MLPSLRVPHAPTRWADSVADLHDWDWSAIPTLPPLLLADGSRPAEQTTSVRVCADSSALYVRFDCDDRDIWATYTRRDDPIYDEEVVELFLAPGEATPTRYYEFEISPTGVLFDALIENPLRTRAEIMINTSWDCNGIRWAAVRDDAAQHWFATLVIPWDALVEPHDRPTVWRANFYRIERPRDGTPEYSCWSPTMTEPADFHQPTFFGTLDLVECYADH